MAYHEQQGLHVIGQHSAPSVFDDRYGGRRNAGRFYGGCRKVSKREQKMVFPRQKIAFAGPLVGYGPEDAIDNDEGCGAEKNDGLRHYLVVASVPGRSLLSFSTCCSPS